jgi:hypothetical protein
MPALTRHEALAALEAAQNELDSLINQLTDADLDEPRTIGDWAAKDVIGHVAFWEELALQTIDSYRGGVTPRVEKMKTDELNAQNQAEQAGHSIFEVRARAGDAHASLVSAIGTLTDHEWHAPLSWPNARPGSLAEMLGGVLGSEGRPFGHAYAHTEDLRAFVATRAR